MKKLLLFLILFANPVYSQEQKSLAEGTIKKEFHVKSSFNKTTEWMEENQKEVRKAMGIEVLKDLGNGKLKVKKETSKGIFVWIMQEKFEKKENVYRYKSNLIQSLEGKMDYSNTEITVTPGKKNASNISMKVSAGINDIDISDFEIRFDINLHTNKAKKLLESNLD